MTLLLIPTPFLISIQAPRCNVINATFRQGRSGFAHRVENSETSSSRTTDEPAAIFYVRKPQDPQFPAETVAPCSRSHWTPPALMSRRSSLFGIQTCHWAQEPDQELRSVSQAATRNRRILWLSGLPAVVQEKALGGENHGSHASWSWIVGHLPPPAHVDLHVGWLWPGGTHRKSALSSKGATFHLVALPRTRLGLSY